MYRHELDREYAWFVIKAWGANLWRQGIYKEKDYDQVSLGYLIWVLKEGNAFMREKASIELIKRVPELNEVEARYVENHTEGGLYGDHFNLHHLAFNRKHELWRVRTKREKLETALRLLEHGTPRQKEWAESYLKE